MVYAKKKDCRSSPHKRKLFKAIPHKDIALIAKNGRLGQQQVACVFYLFVIKLVIGRCFYEYKGHYL